MSENSLNFYKNLKAFTDEKDIFNESHYKKLPGDWYVIISDIKASTKAIEEGYYKDVNTIGVASIIAVKNACGDLPIPYIFGGDGAIIFIPPQKVETAKKAITVSKKKAAEQFNLDLRISIIPVQDIYNNGGELLIAKRQLSASGTLAMAKGSGLSLAEDLTKKSDLYTSASTLSDFHDAHNGFVCRFEPVKSQLNKVSAHLNLEKDINTIKYSDASTYKELKLKHGGISKFLIFSFTSIMMNLYAFVKKIQRQSVLTIDDLAKNTDQIKFDNTLRTVLDVSPEQKELVLTLLSTMHAQNKIVYGVHSSKTALMTCYVGSSTDHMHFIDGDSGGYAVAAIQLKEMKAKLNRR